MSNNKIPKTLPSRIIFPTEEFSELDTLSESCRTDICFQICQNVSRRLGEYYGSRPKEWRIFLEVMSD